MNERKDDYHHQSFNQRVSSTDFNTFLNSVRRMMMLSKASDGKEHQGDHNLSHSEIKRYSRHLVLSDVGMEGQSKLKQSSVLVIGAGGLGSPCLMYLAAAGVGHVGIVDADVVDESNLQRQIIHGTSTINKSKCQSARQRIQDINPNVSVRVYEEEFTSSSAMRILKDGFSTIKPNWDVVVDGSDNFPTKYLSNDACEITGIPWVYSAILAFEGQISVFNYKNGPSYRDMLPTPPPPGDVPSCAEGGVLGVLPGTMGCLQATEVIKIILGGHDKGLLSGRILVFKALDMKFTEIGLRKIAGQREKITELIDYNGYCAGPKDASTATEATVPRNSNMNASVSGGSRTMDEIDEDTRTELQEQTYHTISPKDALHKLSQGWSPWVLDVRLQTENDIIALPFTDMVVPHRTVNIGCIPETGDVLVYCKAGARSKKACMILMESGVDSKRLWNLDGGIMKWQTEVDPRMPRY